MVRPPNWIDKANAVVKFVDNPCDFDKWQVYFETAIVPLGAALLVITSFGMDDVIRGVARPKGVRSRRHRRRGRKGGRGFRGIPEIGEMIGSTVVGGRVAEGRRVSQGVKNFWIVDRVLQRGLWYWLVFDVVSEFLYAWSTILMKTERCQANVKNRLTALGDGGGLIAILGWQALLCPNVQPQSQGITWNVSTGTLPPGIYQVVTAVVFKNTGFLSNTVRCGIASDPLFNDILDRSDPVATDPGFEGQCISSVELAGPGTFTVGWRNERGGTTGLWSGTFIMQIGF